MNKVLIITYYWPPAGGAGVQRVLKFAKYLPQFGWQPVILTVENPDAPIYDDSLFNDVPKECKVYHSKKWEPFDLYKKFTGRKGDEKIPADVMLVKKDASIKEKVANWIRTNVFIPDAKIGWIPYGVKLGLEIIEKEGIDLIFSTQPPHTVGVIAKKIAAKSGVKWVADFRDPWMEIVFYQNNKRSWITRKIDGRLEKGVLKGANGLTVVSDDMVRLFKEKIGESKYKVIPNGFDESDIEDITFSKNEKFTIAYTGVLSKDRIPYPLIYALKQFVKEGNRNFKIILAGKNCPEFDELINKNGLSSYVEKKGYLIHKESTKVLQSSDVLLLVINNVPDNKGVLTGKIFEYFGCRKPIFAIGPVDGNANELLKEAGSGEMIDYSDDNGAYQLLTKMYNDWKNNSTNYQFNSDRFARRNLTKELTEFFEFTLNN